MSDHSDFGVADEMHDLTERVDSVESVASEAREHANNVPLIGEALQLIHAMLGDLIEAADVDVAEYEADLDRLNVIAALIS